MAIKKSKDTANIEVVKPVEETDIADEILEEVKDSETLSVDKSVETGVENIPTTEYNVKIRMREDHYCCIGGERYDLKKGKLYTVPENVKRILNDAGFLAPL